MGNSAHYKNENWKVYIYTSNLSSLALWLWGRTRNSSAKRMHSRTFSGETKSSATFIHDWRRQMQSKNIFLVSLLYYETTISFIKITGYRMCITQSEHPSIVRAQIFLCVWPHQTHISLVKLWKIGSFSWWLDLLAYGPITIEPEHGCKFVAVFEAKLFRNYYSNHFCGWSSLLH